MATTTNLVILEHLVTQLSTIAATATATASVYATATSSAYNNTVLSVDREYIERSYDQYPFIYINDVDDKYIKRICKNLYQKILEVHVVGLIWDDRTNTHTPQLGTTLQNFKNDVQVALSSDVDTFFNTEDIELQIMNIETEDQYVPPNALFNCILYIQYYSEN